MAEKKVTDYSKANARLKMLENTIGRELALYCMCATADRPLIQSIEYNTWEDYITKIIADKEMADLRFKDGVTDINAISGEYEDDIDKWQDVWGTGFTVQEYQRLDALFATYSERLIRAGGMDAKQEDTLRVCTKMRLEADKALQAGGKANIDIAFKLNKMIQENLSEENLRKKDEKPIEQVRIDTIIDSLEKAGMTKNGKILALPELQEQLLRRLGALGGKPSHKYPYTLDAADQMIYMIANNMYKNDSLPEISELPDNMRFDENVSAEFSPEPNEDEIEAYTKLGLVRERNHTKKRGRPPKNKGDAK